MDNVIDLNSYMNQEWERLEPKEKALCLNYKRQLLKDMKIKNELINKVSSIHEKYPDFHLGCLPPEGA